MVIDIEEGAQLLEAAAALRFGQRSRAARAAKFRRRSLDYPPPFIIDLDRPPGAVAQVKVEPAPVLGHAQVDRTLFSVKQRLRLEQLRRGADRLSARALAGIEVIESQQKKLEGARTDRIVLPVSVNANRGPALLVGIMKQLQPRVQSQPDQSVGL